METLLFYIQLGFEHVTDINGLDHFYFIIALCLPFGWKQWKRLLVGDPFHLGAQSFLNWELLCWLPFFKLLVDRVANPITIGLSCLPVLLSFQPNRNAFSSALTFFFGLIHGLGFGRYFSMMVNGDEAALSLFFRHWC